jgi:hypothetical protein
MKKPKICFNAGLFYNVGATETVYQYYKTSLAGKFDFVLSGYLDDKVAQYIPTIGKPEPTRSGDNNLKAHWYPLTKQNSRDIDLFVFYFDHGNFYDPLDSPGELEKVVSAIPREKVIVIDADGKSNPITCEEGDSNHKSEDIRQRWLLTFNALTDRVFQPSFGINAPSVKPFMFWGYRAQEQKPELKYDLMYLGSNWFRLERTIDFMKNLRNLRDLYPRVVLMGKNWLTVDQYWPEATGQNLDFFIKNNIEVREFMSKFGEFTRIIGTSRFSPILIRPVLNKMKMVTPRMFETFASGTTPILPNSFDYAKHLYGKNADELIIGNTPEEKLRDMAQRESHYHLIASSIKGHLKANHSFEKRVDELLKIGGIDG